MVIGFLIIFAIKKIDQRIEVYYVERELKIITESFNQQMNAVNNNFLRQIRRK